MVSRNALSRRDKGNLIAIVGIVVLLVLTYFAVRS
jgi:hypothetical protein